MNQASCSLQHRKRYCAFKLNSQLMVRLVHSWLELPTHLVLKEDRAATSFAHLEHAGTSLHPRSESWSLKEWKQGKRGELFLVPGCARLDPVTERMPKSEASDRDIVRCLHTD